MGNTIFFYGALGFAVSVVGAAWVRFALKTIQCLCVTGNLPNVLLKPQHIATGSTAASRDIHSTTALDTRCSIVPGASAGISAVLCGARLPQPISQA